MAEEAISDAEAARSEVVDHFTLTLPVGARLVVMSDLHLMQQATESSRRATDAITAGLAEWSGPGVVVLAGDCFELLAESHLDPGRALDSHPGFADELARWGGADDRHVVVLPGNHDGHLAWHQPAIDTVTRRLAATMALSLEVVAESAGSRILVEHGHQLDPANSFVDPRDPAETPLGHHVVQDLLPLLEGVTATRWGEGLELVADPMDVPTIVGSRLLYRQILPLLAMVSVPLVAAVLLGLAGLFGAPTTGAAAIAGIVALVVAVAVVGGAVFWGGVGWRSFRGVELDTSGGAAPGNDAARDRAQSLMAEGYSAYVTGHTHIPELTALDRSVYANPGCGGGLLHRRPGRGPLPDAFVMARHVSWVEIDLPAHPGTEAPARARLLVAHEERPGISPLERWATRPAAPAPPSPVVTAEVMIGGGVVAGTTMRG